jgi:aminomethyltransferase
MSADALRTTPLHAAHLALGARMMPFAGFDMPVQYSGILDEHRAVREAAGLFDVSHMGEFWIRGPQALDLAQALVTNDVSKLTDGRALYAVLCHPSGGAVDDLLVYRVAADEVMLVVNASNIDKDWAHISGVHADLGFDCALTNASDDTALLALQGPRAFEIFEAASGVDASGIPYYHFERPAPGAVLGADGVILSHTGYTGERGLEIYCRNADAPHIWQALLDAGAPLGLLPAGLGARDTLRLEAGYSLYGHELTDDITPLEAGLGWVVKLDAGDFVGRDALASLKSAGPARRLVGFVLDERGIPRQGCRLTDPEGAPIGEVSSGSQSPALGTGIGLGFVPNDPAWTAPGTRLGVEIRGKVLAATVRKPPFHTSG